MTEKAVFMTLEGGEGGGKGSVAQYIREQFVVRGLPLHFYHEPGGTSFGEEIRSMLLTLPPKHVHKRTALLGFTASRAQLVSKAIIPDLETGTSVLADRYIDSTLAIQGHAQRCGPKKLVRMVNTFATTGLMPHLTILLDVPAQVGLQRKKDQGEWNEWEARGPKFHERIRQGFLIEARRDPKRIQVVDATLPIQSVRVLAWEHVERLLKLRGLM